MKKGKGSIALAAIAFFLLPTVVAAEPDAGEISIVLGDDARLVNGGRTLAFEGVVTCDLAEGFEQDIQEVLVFASQRRGRATIEGQGGGGPIVCDGAARTYTFRAHALSGQRVDERFHGGRATVSVFVLVCGSLDGEPICEQADSGKHQVRVRGH